MAWMAEWAASLVVKDTKPKHLDRLVCLSMNTLAETMVPKGWNVWLRSESVNSWERKW